MKKETIKLDPVLIEAHMRPASRTEALKTLVGRLQKFGYVNDNYCRQVIAREGEYPTGLAFEGITVALPHANPEDVLEPACAIGRCLKPVPFGNMEAPDEELLVELIFIPALNNPDDHLSLLSQLVDFFGDQEQVKALRAAANGEELCEVFKNYLLVNSKEEEE